MSVRDAPVSGAWPAVRVVPEKILFHFQSLRFGWTFLLVGASEFGPSVVFLRPARRLWMRFNPTTNVLTKSSSNSVYRW